ncbi:unnamed protein product [Cyprideis torosa]|uniref:Uncharacterized protein n=1 Tax=Cyprideis torosa TaxID=163714 RepID=A0A7R8ZPT5_9CRUS|nr:unnamed protein product [Cyprideis torosa]CAG0890578.1 unnamed protein product [Cyprideis torosa]
MTQSSLDSGSQIAPAMAMVPNGTNGQAILPPAPGEIDESLYSRQLYVLGHEANGRFRHSDLSFGFGVAGIDGLGVEIAKCVILGGVRGVTLHDTVEVTKEDLTSQYYLTPEDIGKNRASACVEQLAELNTYVHTKVYTGELTPEYIQKFKDQTLISKDAKSTKLPVKSKTSSERPLPPAAVIVLCGPNRTEDAIRLSEFTHVKGISLILAQVSGVFGMVFCDFGPKFVVNDATGENPATAMIASITREKEGMVACIDESRHGFEDGDYVTFSEIKGMTQLNGAPPMKIKVKGSDTFTIGDTTYFDPYVTGGVVVQVKMPVEISFLSFPKALAAPEFVMSDFAKMDRPPILHACFQALAEFRKKHKRDPKALVAEQRGEQDESETVMKTIKEARAKCLKIQRLLRAGAGSTASTSMTGGGAATSSDGRDVSLLKLTLPKFHGDPLKYQEFWDASNISVHASTKYTDGQKLTYLKMYVDGEAQRALAGWDSTEANYKEALEYFQRRFGNPELRKDALAMKLLDLEAVEVPDAAKLRHLIDDIVGATRSLEALGVKMDSFEFMVRVLMTKKIPMSCFQDFQRSYKTAEERTLKNLLTFLEEEVAIMERARTQHGKEKLQCAGLEESYEGHGSAHALRVSEKVKGQGRGARGQDKGKGSSSKGPTLCLFCQGSHATKDCAADMTLEEKHGKLVEARVCFKCAGKRHHSRDCYSKWQCKNCEGKHMTSMCKKKADENAKVGQAGVGLMRTALVQVNQGPLTSLMADTGCSRTFIREDLAKEAKAEVLREENLTIEVFGGKTEQRRCQVVKVRLTGVGCQGTLDVEAVCFPDLGSSGGEFSSAVAAECYKSFGAPAHYPGQQNKVGILLGEDCYDHVVTGPTQPLTTGLKATRSIFGWMIHGRSERAAVVKVCKANFDLSHFWELDHLGIKEVDLDKEDVLYRVERKDGRYWVSWPWREELRPSDNKGIAEARLTRLLAKMTPEEKAEYSWALRGRHAVVGDLGKAFLQIRLNETDRDVTRFLWDGQEYRSTSVLFGATSSPGILQTVLDFHIQTLLEEGDLPADTLKQIREDLYVDDLASSLDSDEEIEQYWKKAKEAFKRASMDLRKCRTTAAGLKSLEEQQAPGGKQAAEMKVPRWMGTKNREGTTLHCFVDASGRIYAGVVFVRVKSSSGTVTHLLASKARLVSPKMREGNFSGRFELLACVLGAKLVQSVVEALGWSDVAVTFWTDSRVALHWIAGAPEKWEVFVRNRVRQIREVAGEWRYVPTKMNVADIPTRERGVDEERWKKGPEWLSLGEDSWPEADAGRSVTEIVQQGRAVMADEIWKELVTPRVSRWRVLVGSVKRIIERVRRQRGQQEYDPAELEKAAVTVIVRAVQGFAFQEECEALSEGKEVPRRSPLADFGPFLDESGVLRMGGRLHKTNKGPQEAVHPAILSRVGSVELLVMNVHAGLFHAGVGTTLAVLTKKGSCPWFMRPAGVDQ